MLHGNRVDFTKIRESDHNPENNQDSDHKAPDPSARMHYAVCGERSVIDHDGGPANELQYIQDSKRMLPFCPKLIFTVSMALFLTLPPITPARNSIRHPMIWPIRIAARPFPMPSGAR